MLQEGGERQALEVSLLLKHLPACTWPPAGDLAFDLGNPRHPQPNNQGSECLTRRPLGLNELKRPKAT